MLHGVTQARSAIRRRPSTPAPAWDGKERSLNWPLHFARYFQSLKKLQSTASTKAQQHQGRIRCVLRMPRQRDASSTDRMIE